MDKVIFRESDHSYWLGEKQLISVTQLLEKHSLGTNYGAVNPEVLSVKAERGKQIHKEIEDYIKTGETGFTKELLDFIDIAEEMKLVTVESEIIVNNELVAGTADLMGVTYKGKKILADIKTTATVSKRAWAWQLSLYERLSGETFDNLFILHLCENSKVIPIKRIPAEEIDRLLECEKRGEIFQEQGLIVTGELLECVCQAEQILKKAEAEKDAAEITAKEFRQKLYDAMGEQGIASWETLDKSMLITRVEPTTKASIDSAKLKKDLPDIAAKYTKTSLVKGYVKITLREE